MIISTDFDHTCLFEVGGANLETLWNLNSLNVDGNKFFVVTTANDTPEKRKQIHQFFEDAKNGVFADDSWDVGSVDLNIEDVIFTNGGSKVPALKEIKSELHFEDCTFEIKQIEDAGIRAVLSFNEEKWNEFMDSL